MENNSKRRESLNNQRPEQSIDDNHDILASQPLRAQQANNPERLGNVEVETYGGVSPAFSHDKPPSHFNPSIDPQSKFRDIYADTYKKPEPKTRKPPEKQFSWIDRMNASAEKEEKNTAPKEVEDEGFVSKFMEFFHPFTEILGVADSNTQRTQPSSSHDISTKQHNIEFEPSENAYDATQANFATRKDDTSLEQKDLSRPSGSSDIQTTYQSFRTPEFNASDEHYDELQKSNGLDDNARRNIWSKSGSQQATDVDASQTRSATDIRQQLADNINKSSTSRYPRSSFGTRKPDSFRTQEKAYYPGAASPNWAAGTTMVSDTARQSDQTATMNAPDYLQQGQGSQQRSRQGSAGAVKPSSYLSIPPMVPSEMSLEALLHPSRQVDWLSGFDLGLSNLFAEQPDAGQAYYPAQQFPKEVRPSSYQITPPMVPSEMSLEALLHPSNQIDWLSYSDLGLSNLFAEEPDTGRASYASQKFPKEVRPSSYQIMPPMLPSERSLEALLHPSNQVDWLLYSDLGLSNLFAEESDTGRASYASQKFPEVLKPSNYLIMPPMVPSEMSLEALLHPSKLIDWLWGFDFGLGNLFTEEPDTERVSHPSQESPREVTAMEKSEVITPPTIASSKALNCLFNPSPTSQDWALGVDDIGLKQLMTQDSRLPDLSISHNSVNRIHTSDQRPKTTSALHSPTEGETTFVAVVQPTPHALALSKFSLFDPEDLAGVMDISPSSTRRVHQTIQRPRSRSEKLGSEGQVKDLPMAIDKRDSWSAYMAHNDIQEGRQRELKRYESPGSLARDKYSQQEGIQSREPTLSKDTAIDVKAAVEDRRNRKREWRADQRSKDWADDMDDDQLEVLYPADYESSWASNEVSGSKSGKVNKSLSQPADTYEKTWKESQIPTWSSTSAYGIKAPFIFPLFSFVSHARETAIPTEEHTTSREWKPANQRELGKQTSQSAQGVSDSLQQLEKFEDQVDVKLHGIVETVASGVGAVAGSAVGALSYLFGESTQTEKAPNDKVSSYLNHANMTGEDQQYENESKLAKAIPDSSHSRLIGADEQLFMAKKDNPNLSLGHVDDDSRVLDFQPSLSKPAQRLQTPTGQSIGELKSVSDSMTDSNLSQPSVNPQITPERGIGSVPSEKDPLLHPSLSRPSTQPELSTEQSVGSVAPGGYLTQTTPSQIPTSSVEQTTPLMAESGGLATDDLQRNTATDPLSQQHGQTKTVNEDSKTPENDDSIRELFNGDPDSVRQPYTLNQPKETSMDDRRQIWEATMSNALGQAAGTLGQQPQSKEKKLNLENYHVADSGYKPSSYDPGRNQFDSDFENWKHDSPLSTPVRNTGGKDLDENENYNSNASEKGSNTTAPLFSQEQHSSSETPVSERPAWDRVEFHDPSDYMKGTESHMQQMQKQPEAAHLTTESPSTGQTSWIRSKLSKPRDRAAR